MHTLYHNQRPSNIGTLGRVQGEIYMKVKGYYLNRVHSDQMVLEIVRRKAALCVLWPKATKSGLSLLISDGSCDGQAGRLDG